MGWVVAVGAVWFGVVLKALVGSIRMLWVRMGIVLLRVGILLIGGLLVGVLLVWMLLWVLVRVLCVLRWCGRPQIVRNGG